MKSYFKYYLCLFCCNYVCAPVYGEYVTISEPVLREVEPLIITTKLGETIKLPMPFPTVTMGAVQLHITKPNGDNVPYSDNSKINKEIVFNVNNNTLDHNQERNSILFLNENENIDINKRRIITNMLIVSGDSNNISEYEDKVVNLGPLGHEDHGNWVLSAEYRDIRGDSTEMFRVVSVEIIEKVPIHPSKTCVSIGETHYLRLETKVPDLESCQLIAPDTTFDRYYQRDMDYQESCGYILKNVTIDDGGVWKIVAVGKIVYMGEGMLNIQNKIL